MGGSASKYYRFHCLCIIQIKEGTEITKVIAIALYLIYDIVKGSCKSLHSARKKHKSTEPIVIKYTDNWYFLGEMLN